MPVWFIYNTPSEIIVCLRISVHHFASSHSYHYYPIEIHQSMRIKKSILQKKPSPKKKPVPDLDPTTNLDLHLEIWMQLKEKMANHFLKR